MEGGKSALGGWHLCLECEGSSFLSQESGGGGDAPGSGVSSRSWNLKAGVFSIQELGGGCGPEFRA